MSEVLRPECLYVCTSICLSVCLSARESQNRLTACPNFTQFSITITKGHSRQPVSFESSIKSCNVLAKLCFNFYVQVDNRWISTLLSYLLGYVSWTAKKIDMWRPYFTAPTPAASAISHYYRFLYLAHHFSHAAAAPSPPLGVRSVKPATDEPGCPAVLPGRAIRLSFSHPVYPAGPHGRQGDPATGCKGYWRQLWKSK